MNWWEILIKFPICTSKSCPRTWRNFRIRMLLLWKPEPKLITQTNDRKMAWCGWKYSVQTNSRYPMTNKKIWNKVNKISPEHVKLLQRQDKIKIKSTISSWNVGYVERIGSRKLLIGIWFKWRNQSTGHPTYDEWEETLFFLFHTYLRWKLLPPTERKRSSKLLPSKEQKHSYRYNRQALH